MKTTNYIKAKPFNHVWLACSAFIWELNTTYFSTVASELREHDVAIAVGLFSGHFGRPNILNTTLHEAAEKNRAFNGKLQSVEALDTLVLIVSDIQVRIAGQTFSHWVLQNNYIYLLHQFLQRRNINLLLYS